MKDEPDQYQGRTIREGHPTGETRWVELQCKIPNPTLDWAVLDNKIIYARVILDGKIVADCPSLEAARAAKRLLSGNP